MINARAQIYWLNSRNKSGQPIISKIPYKPIIVFKGQYNGLIGEKEAMYPLWSCVIFNEKVKGNESTATIRYLAEKAPFEFFKIGAEFELYECKDCVAVGKILEIIE